MSDQGQLDREDRITARRATPRDHMPSCPGREKPDWRAAYAVCDCWVGGKAPGPGGVILDMSESTATAELAKTRAAILEGRRPPLDLGDSMDDRGSPAGWVMGDGSHTLMAAVREAAGETVIVDRKLLEEALAQILATAYDWDRSCCNVCREYADIDDEDLEAVPPPGVDVFEDMGFKSPIICEHKPDCSYVRTRDALKKALGE